MFRNTLKIAALIVATCIAAVTAYAAPEAERTIAIGTAGVTGVYYPAGGAICRLVNRGRKIHGVRCGVESTLGSINNLEFIRKHDLDIGVVQSDMLYHAYRGDDLFKDVGPDADLRVLMFLHPEPFTIIVRKSSDIKTFKDLKGQRIYTGPPGSGMAVTMEELMRYHGWGDRDFVRAQNISPDNQSQALCAGQIDAMIFAGGHPNGAIQQVTSACDTQLVDISGPVIDRMIRDNPYYSKAVIPGGMYVGTSHDIQTFGMDAVLVTSSRLDDETAYLVTRSVFDNLDNFKTLHPVFATLNRKEMTARNDIAPFHPGALKYYEEQGLIH